MASAVDRPVKLWRVVPSTGDRDVNNGNGVMKSAEVS